MKKRDLSKIALGFRPATHEIKALSYKFTFGKYKGETVEFVLGCDPSYIPYLHDEKIAKVSADILDYADEADMDQRFDEAVEEELRGMSMWDYIGDD